ncbi:hypothetical protein EJ110_NYTH13283 [Nymphaea thermarum]|nr:hypothetical protein EJ110_NYTH13283 [Nymphaea thermarum]
MRRPLGGYFHHLGSFILGDPKIIQRTRPISNGTFYPESRATLECTGSMSKECLRPNKAKVHSSTSLSDVVKRYGETIGRQCHIEKDLDLKVNSGAEPTNICLIVKLHLRDTFTPKIYRKYFK